MNLQLPCGLNDKGRFKERFSVLHAVTFAGQIYDLGPEIKRSNSAVASTSRKVYSIQ